MSAQLPVKFDLIRKQLFVENLMLRMSPVDAVRAAGFDGVHLKRIATKLLEDEEVVEMIAVQKERIAEYYDVSRDKVLRDLVDAKEMARVQGDVKGMVMGLKEVSEVQGYHAPKQVAVEQRHLSGDVSRLRQVSDEELLELAEEADFTVVELTAKEG